jgi:hypothetical protein
MLSSNHYSGSRRAENSNAGTILSSVVVFWAAMNREVKQPVLISHSPRFETDPKLHTALQVIERGISRVLKECAENPGPVGDQARRFLALPKDVGMAQLLPLLKPFFEAYADWLFQNSGEEGRLIVRLGGNSLTIPM